MSYFIWWWKSAPMWISDNRTIEYEGPSSCIEKTDLLYNEVDTSKECRLANGAIIWPLGHNCPLSLDSTNTIIIRWQILLTTINIGWIFTEDVMGITKWLAGGVFLFQFFNALLQLSAAELRPLHYWLTLLPDERLKCQHGLRVIRVCGIESFAWFN